MRAIGQSTDWEKLPRDLETFPKVLAVEWTLNLCSLTHFTAHHGKACIY